MDPFVSLLVSQSLEGLLTEATLVTAFVSMGVLVCFLLIVRGKSCIADSAIVRHHAGVLDHLVDASRVCAGKPFIAVSAFVRLGQSEMRHFVLRLGSRLDESHIAELALVCSFTGVDGFVVCSREFPREYFGTVLARIRGLFLWAPTGRLGW